MIFRLILTLGLASCVIECSAQSDSLPKKHVANETELAAYFDSTAYRYVFMMGHYSEADSIWDMDSSRPVLERIVGDDKFSKRAAFFSAEILFDHCDWRPEGKLKIRVAEIYVTALKENYSGIGNPWGVPDDTGDIGEHILDFGEVLVIALKPLLHCETPVRYEGSGADVMRAREQKYRVKDIAASYICSIRGIKFDADQDQENRDKQIKKIRKKI